MYHYQLDPDFIEVKLIDLEDWLRRNNLRVDCIKDETWEDCKKEIHTLFKESLSIDEDVLLEKVHRVKTDKNKKGNAPRTIVCRTINYKDKV